MWSVRSSKFGSLAFGIVCILPLACGAPESGEALDSDPERPDPAGSSTSPLPSVSAPSPSAPGPIATAPDAGAGPILDEPVDDARRCAPPAGVSGSPTTAAEVVHLINALPRPVTIACFLESLDRPLRVNLTSSVFSAQPAQGSRSPRVFLFIEGLTLSVVPEGVGAPFLELAEAREVNRSLKAEIEFPILEELPMEHMFERIMFNDWITTCGLCHAVEQPDTETSFPNAFVSDALRPQDSQYVSLEFLREQYQTCDAELEPERCEILEGLFGYGEVVEVSFPREMSTFF